MKNYKLDGLEILHLKDGSIGYESMFKDGKMHGLSTGFRFGLLWYEIIYKNGIENGLSVTFYY